MDSLTMQMNDWEGKMEPSSPLDFSQQIVAEEDVIIPYDNLSYDFCSERLYNDTLIDLEELKPNPSILLNSDVLVTPVEELKVNLLEDPCKLKPLSCEQVPLDSYGQLPTVLEDAFYEYTLQPAAKASLGSNVETQMEFTFTSVGGMEVTNHLTPPQTPPQSTSFGGTTGSVLPMQVSTYSVPVPSQQQQFVYVPVVGAQSLPLLQQQPQVSPQGTFEYYLADEYSSTAQPGANNTLQQYQPQLPEPLQQVPGAIDSNSPFNLGDQCYTPQQLNEMNSIVRSLLCDQHQASEEQSLFTFNVEDDDSSQFSEAGSVENGGSSSSSSMVARSPVYSDSAESSVYYGCNNDGDDEDWSPAKTKKLSLGDRKGGSVTKKRSATATSTRLYGRGTEEKKSRKKEQNKNAATRYRLKQKDKMKEILTEESQLLERNKELEAKSLQLGRDLRCIKKLVRELFQQNGLM